MPALTPATGIGRTSGILEMRLVTTLLAAAVSTALLCGPLAAAPIAIRVQNMDLEPNLDSAEPAVSADGRTLVFVSNATNLAPAGHGELYSYDRIADRIRALTTAVDGNAFAPAISADGRYVAFATDDNELATPDCIGTGSGNDVLRADLATTPPTFLRVSRAAACAPGAPVAANGSSNHPAISGDGRFVAFHSSATNLVVPAPSGGRAHLYEMDMTTRELRLVTRATDGSEGNSGSLPLENNAYSRDGRLLVFATDATNLATVNAGNVSDAILRRIDRSSGVVSFENLNRSVAGLVGNLSSSVPSLSPSGQYAIFLSNADNLLPGGRSGSRFYVRDLAANTLRGLPVPPDMGSCSRGRIDDRGDAVLYCQPVQGGATNAQQLFRVSAAGTATLLSKSHLDAGLGNGRSGEDFSLSADGRVLVTESAASNLAPGDGNGDADIYMIAEPDVFDELFRDGFE
jgi:Tol biopolymer transport system component